MKIITTEEMLDFIFSQPPEKVVDWMENESSEPCGCLMVQFGRDNQLEFDSCSYRNWNSIDLSTKIARFEPDVHYFDFRPRDFSKRISTYAEIQTYCKGRFSNYVPKS
jgi:hypothetical protein